MQRLEMQCRQLQEMPHATAQRHVLQQQHQQPQQQQQHQWILMMQMRHWLRQCSWKEVKTERLLLLRRSRLAMARGAGS
jgi:hypothetical protein